ncbi:hypothetical protein [Bradyrhizobium guangdongense]
MSTKQNAAVTEAAFITEPPLSLATLAAFPRALVVKEVATLLKCSERHVYTLNARGTLPNIKGMGAALRFAPLVVDALANGTTEAAIA